MFIFYWPFFQLWLNLLCGATGILTGPFQVVFNPAPAFADGVGIEPIADDRIIRPDSFGMSDQGDDQSIASVTALNAGYERWEIVIFFPDMKDQMHRAWMPLAIFQIMEFGYIYPVNGNEFDPFKVDRGLIITFALRKP